MYGPLPANQSVQYVVPLTGNTVAVSSSTTQLILEPAGTLATLTVTLPASPSNGQTVSLSSTAAITALTLNGGTIVGAVTTLAANAFAAYCFQGTKWYRVG